MLKIIIEDSIKATKIHLTKWKDILTACSQSGPSQENGNHIMYFKQKIYYRELVIQVLEVQKKYTEAIHKQL